MYSTERFDYMISSAATSYTKKSLSKELIIATYIETERPGDDEGKALVLTRALGLHKQAN